MEPNESLTPKCADCGEYLDPTERNCRHVEGALPHMGIDQHKIVARRLNFMTGQIDILMAREKARQASRKSAAKKRAATRATND